MLEFPFRWCPRISTYQLWIWKIKMFIMFALLCVSSNASFMTYWTYGSSWHAHDDEQRRMGECSYADKYLLSSWPSPLRTCICDRMDRCKRSSNRPECVQHVRPVRRFQLMMCIHRWPRTLWSRASYRISPILHRVVCVRQRLMSFLRRSNRWPQRLRHLSSSRDEHNGRWCPSWWCGI